MSLLLRYVFLLGAVCASSMPALGEVSLEEALIQAAPSADPKVIRLAVEAAACAAGEGKPAAQRLAVIDYSRPSTQPRLWVFDLAARKRLYAELVAHGRNSGANYTRSFSNALGSYESSLGLFRTRDTYNGRNGYSLRMEGLEPGFNDRAAERAIVMHGAPYVNTKFLRTQGRLGRSLGCPAVRQEVARPLINALKGGQYVFSYYPDPIWLASSTYVKCATQRIAAADSKPPADGMKLATNST